MKSLILLLASCPFLGAVTPILVHISGSENSRTQSGFSANTTFNMPNADGPVISGNCFGVAFAYSTINLSATPVVSDDKSDTFYQVAQNPSDTPNQRLAKVWMTPPVTTGPSMISISWPGAGGASGTEYIHAVTFEVANCGATSGAISDGSSSAVVTGTSIAAGNLTPGTAGDLIMQFGWVDSAPTTAPAFTSATSHGSNSGVVWEMELDEMLDGLIVQSGVDSLSSALNPTMTTPSSATLITIAFAIKGARAGGVPTGMHIFRDMHVSMMQTSLGGVGYSNPSVTHFLSSGNLLLVAATGGCDIIGVTYGGVSLNKRVSYVGTGSSETEQFFTLENYTPSATSLISITPNLTCTGPDVDFTWTLICFDIVGASTTPYDTQGTASGNQATCTGTCSITGASVTPTTTSGMLFGETSEFFNQVASVSGGAWILDTIAQLPATQSPPIDQQNGTAHFYNLATSTQTPTWTYADASTPAGHWAAADIALEAAPLSNTCVTCYIDYELGSDLNDGTAKTTGGGHGPWQHAPGMLGLTPAGASTGDGCTSNCAAQSPLPGDKYILKGGVIWPYTTLPWQPTMSGNATTSGTYGCAGTGCIYIGYDPTWNKGIVNSVTLTRDLGGCNPASPPTVVFSGGGGSSAAATANVIPSAAGTAEPNVAGFVYHVTMTNQGSGYTSNPTVTISGGGCTLVTAVADIQRPVIDAGSGSAIAWPVGTGAGALVYGPGLTPTGSFLIIDHLEIRNILNTVRTTGILTAMLGNEQGGTGHVTYSNNYVHGRFTTCVLQSCIPGGWPANDQEQADKGIEYTNASDEVSGNVMENGDAYETGTSSTTCSTNLPCIFSESSVAGSPGLQGGWIHGNVMYSVRWLGHVGGSGATPLVESNNEMWLVLYDVGTAHVNEMYIESTTGTNYIYNNIFHSAVSGASNQQQMGNGTTQYFFNNISWGLGGGTSNYGLDAIQGAGASGGTFLFANNTMVSNSGTRTCIDGSGAGFSSALTVTLQNNQCITTQNPYWVAIASATYKNSAGSTTAANVQAASTIQTAATATSQGYVASNLYAPTLSSNDTVTFSSGGTSANLTSLCSGALVPLCSDINGVARPSSGGWQAGAYQLNSASSTGNTTVAGPRVSAGPVTKH